MSIVPLLVAGLAGGLIVYLIFATRPDALDDGYRPAFIDGVTIWHAVTRKTERAKLAIAGGALLACLVFLAGALS